jgi:hypothetical protein
MTIQIDCIGGGQSGTGAFLGFETCIFIYLYRINRNLVENPIMGPILLPRDVKLGILAFNRGYGYNLPV